MRKTLTGIAAMAASLSGGCCSPWKESDTWSFALTRDVLDRDWSDGDPSSVDPSSLPCVHGGVDELWILALFFAPTLIDLALLPVTGVHDLAVE